MQTMSLHQALLRAVVLCLLLSACEPGDTLGVREQALGSSASPPGESRVLLSENFEKGVITSPPWIVSGDVGVRGDAARSGEKGVRLSGEASLEARLSTTGLRAIEVSFDARGVGLDLFEALRVDVAADGHDYVPIGRIKAGRWQRRSFRLPTMFENHAELRLRFQIIAGDHHGRGARFEGGLLDNVEVVARSASALDAGTPEAGAAGCEDDDDCRALDQPCMQGVCDVSSGQCGSSTRAEGSSCGEASLCDEMGRCLGCGRAAGSTFELVQTNILEAPAHGCTAAVCHGASPGQGRLDLTRARAYEQLVGVPSSASALTRVQPGAPNESFLYRKIAWGTNGTPVAGGGPMPAGGAAPVPTRLLDGLGAWIGAGAAATGFVPGSVASLCEVPCTRDAECSNGDACDGAERCEAGSCVAGAALGCDDGVACTSDRCEPARGCVNETAPGLPCGEGGVCDAAGACASCVPPENTFDAIQSVIFDSPRYGCSGPTCHASGRLLDLRSGTAYAALLGQTGGRAAVIPGSPQTSILYDRLRAKVEGTPSTTGGAPMPRGNYPAITPEELSAVAAWISAGAPRTGVVAGTESVLCIPPAQGARGELTQLWDFPVGRPVTSSPLAFADTVYVAAGDSKVYALDRATGTPRWSHDTRARTIHGGVARAADGSLLLGDGDAVVWKLDALGQVVWSRDLDMTGADHIWNTLTLDAERVYVPIASHGDQPCTKGRTVALDLSTGETVWTRMNVPAGGVCRTDTGVTCDTSADCPGGGACESAVGGAVTARVLLDPSGQSVYVNTVGCYTFPQVGDTDAMMKLDARTGAVQWLQRFSQSEQFGYCAATGVDCRGAEDCGGGTCTPKAAFHDFGFINGPYLLDARMDTGGRRPLLVSANKSGSIHALDPSSGERVWTRAVLPAPVSPRFAGYGLFNGALAYESGRLFAALYEFVPPTLPAPDHLMAFSEIDGSTLWSDDIGKSWSSLTASRGIVYAGTVVANEFYAYLSTSGIRVGTYPLPASSAAAPTIEGDQLFIAYGASGATPVGGVRAYSVR